MKIIIAYFLLISGSSVLIAANPPPLTSDDMNRIIYEGSPIATNSSKRILKLTEDGKLGENDNVIVWAGEYNNQTVAVKIVWDEKTMNDEVAIYNTLGAMTDAKIEEKGVPRVYYYGKVLKNYYAIVMTLFTETLEDRYQNEGQSFSSLNILLIFKRLIEILRYLQNKNVVHNDIKPENIFLRGREVFIGDFDVATSNGVQNDYGTSWFASRNYWDNKTRTSMDDVESLLFTMWSVAGVPMGSTPEGQRLAQVTRDKGEKAYIKEKQKNLKDKDVRKAFESVSDEVLSWGLNPRYDSMIGEMNVAINKIKAKTAGQTGFEWLTRAPALSSASRSLSANLALMKLSRGSSLDKSTRSGSPRLTSYLSTRTSLSAMGTDKSGGTAKSGGKSKSGETAKSSGSKKASLEHSTSFRPIKTSQPGGGGSYSRLEYEWEDSSQDSPECKPKCCIFPSCGKEKK